MACKPKEDHDAHEATHTRRDRIQAAPGRCSGRARNPGGGRDPRDWGHRGHVLPLAPGVRRAEVEPGQAHEGAGDREPALAQSYRRPHARQADPARGRPGKLLSPARRRACVEHIRSVLNVSERRACRALGQHRSTQRKAPRGKADEEQPTADLIELARQYGRYGYRKISALLRDVGWGVNDKRGERIWRREGLKVPPKQPKRSRLWLTDGSCIRLRPEYPNQVWSYDFVEDRTHDGRKFRMLNVIDEFTHECLAIRVDRKLKAIDVIDVLSDLFILRGVPTHIRSDNVLRREGERRTGQQVSIGLQASRSAAFAAWPAAPSRPASPARHPGQAPRSTQTTHALNSPSAHPRGADHSAPGHQT